MLNEVLQFSRYALPCGPLREDEAEYDEGLESLHSRNMHLYDSH